MASKLSFFSLQSAALGDPVPKVLVHLSSFGKVVLGAVNPYISFFFFWLLEYLFQFHQAPPPNLNQNFMPVHSVEATYH